MEFPDHQYSAILFSDIEGYTTMIQDDEEHAIEIVNRYQNELEIAVSLYHGEVKQYYGDGSLSVFEDAADAVSCAQYLQKKLKSLVPLRIGIHYGKVVNHQEKVYGDTVNIASRIESLGQPGAVLFSEDVYKEIEGRGEFSMVSMGHYKFKNVKQKLRVYALENQGLVIPKAGTLTGKLEPARRTKLPQVLIGLLGLVVIVFVWVQLKQPRPAEQVAQAGPMNASIAVLPFTNLSSDSSQEYFADGLAQEVLILLTHDPQLKVISRSSSFSFKGQMLDVPTIAEKLGAQYILDGSVQKYGDSVRISVHLVDAREDNQLWAQSWQHNLSDIFSVQEEIADSVKNALDLQILTDQRPKPQQTKPQAYTLFLQARHLGQQGNVNGLKNAESLLRNVLEIDSLYAPAWAYLSNVLNRQSNIGLLPSAEGHEHARQSARRALEIDSTLASAWSTLASISIYFDRNFKKAERFLEKARSTEPGSLDNLKLASNLSFCLGNIKQAIALDQQAIEIDPVSAKNYLDLGYGYYFDGRYKQAEEMTRRGLLMNPNYLGGPFLLSLVLMKQGRLGEAKQMAYAEQYHILMIQALSLVSYQMSELDSAALYLQKIKDQYAQVAPYQIAQVYGLQNEKDSAFKWLDLAYEYRDGGLVHVKSDPLMSSLTSDRRWEALITKMDFP